MKQIFQCEKESCSYTSESRGIMEEHELHCDNICDYCGDVDQSVEYSGGLDDAGNHHKGKFCDSCFYGALSDHNGYKLEED